MTLGDLGRALLLRWWIALIGILLTLGGAFFGTRTETVYHARTEVVFLAPASARYPNELVTQTESLIVTAGAVAKRINGAGVQPQYGSSLANPIGAPGNGENTWINLINIGTQWVAVFDDQVLLIDAIGSTPREVADRIDAAAERISQELTSLQDDQGTIDPTTYLTVRMSPTEPVVEAVNGNRARAIAMTLAVGGFLTLGVVVTLETVSGSDSRRRTTANN